MNDLLERYGGLLREVDAWFAGCAARHPEQIACRRGCSACCRGLFDITLLDALYLKRGVDALDEPLRRRATDAARIRLNSLSGRFPGFSDPWILNSLPEEEWEAIMPEEDETPCALLLESGDCMVYDHRPMTCRLNGIPLFDLSGEELSDEWCTLNFTAGDPRVCRDLRFGFTELFAQELLLFQELVRRLTGQVMNEVDTIIPAAIVMDPAGMTPVVRRMAAGHRPRR